MKRSVKPTRKRSAKRELFSELVEGMGALADARQAKRTLQTHSVALPSFAPQRLNRIDLCCASGGNAGGDEGDGDDERGHEEVDQRIGRAYRKE